MTPYHNRVANWGDTFGERISYLGRLTAHHFVLTIILHCMKSYYAWLRMAASQTVLPLIPI